MVPLMSKTLFIGMLYCIVLLAVACGPQDARQPLQTPTPPNKAETIPEREITVEPEVSPSLPAEIIATPVSPILTVTRELTMSISPPNQGVVSGGEAALEAARTDLAKRISVLAGEITLVSMEATEWRDASLGCPQKGMMYAQVITPGYLIVLKAQGQQYKYHTNRATTVVLCQK